MAGRFAQKMIEGDASTLDFGPDFNQAHCLLNAEVLLLLEDLQNRRNQEDPSGHALQSQVFQRCLQHVRAFSRFTNREMVRDMRQTLMTNEGLGEFEMAQLGNLCPETAEEAKTR